MPNEDADQVQAESATADDSASTLEDGTPQTQTSQAEDDSLDPLAAAQAEVAQLKDKLLRTAADFDNFRKRSRREVTDAEKKGRDSLLKELLPVFDNLERAGSHAQGSQSQGSETEASIKALADGIDLVIRQFRDTLSRLGVERIETVGQPFDPALHEAIQHLETSDYEPGSIAAEVQPGYREGDRLVRAALVVVAKSPSGQASGGSGPTESNDRG